MEEFQDRMRHWHALEGLALAAEAKLKYRQLASTPEAAALAQDASAKRRTADDFIRDLLGSVAAVPPTGT